VITDLRMGEYDGIEVLRAIKEAQPMTEVIVMTAYGTIESAVEAMRVGAFDYIQKPFTEQELIVKVSKALESRSCTARFSSSRRSSRSATTSRTIDRALAAIRDVLTRVVKIAPTDAIVLITGESGTARS
jgi:two-component system response regulator HydG